MRTTEEIYAELATCIGAMHYDADDAIFRVLAARVDELLRGAAGCWGCRKTGVSRRTTLMNSDGLSPMKSSGVNKCSVRFSPHPRQVGFAHAGDARPSHWRPLK
jgi:hypothetical protein